MRIHGVRSGCGLLLVSLGLLSTSVAQPQPLGLSFPQQISQGVAFTNGSTSSAHLASQAEQAYERLLGELSAQTTTQILQALQQFVAQWPLHAGARLDLALLHCEMGNSSQAEVLFRALENEFVLPAGILQVITLQRERGCSEANESLSDSPLGHFWTEGFVGSTSNANLATRQEKVVFGPEAPIPSLDLSPQSRQRSDQFVGLNAGFSALLAPGFAPQHIPPAYLQVGLSYKAYLRSPWLNTGGLSMAAWQPFDKNGAGPGGRMAVSGIGFGFSKWWVDGRPQEIAVRFRAEHWLPLDSVATGLRAGLATLVSEQRFHGNTAFNSRRVELGVRLHQPMPGRSFASAAFNRFTDYSLGIRPGGDRQGWSGQVAFYWPYARGLMQAAWLAQQTNDQVPYNPLFFQNRVRKNLRQQWLLRHDWARVNRAEVFAQLVIDQANDVLDIFSFQSVSLQVGWVRSW